MKNYFDFKDFVKRKCFPEVKEFLCLTYRSEVEEFLQYFYEKTSMFNNHNKIDRFHFERWVLTIFLLKKIGGWRKYIDYFVNHSLRRNRIPSLYRLFDNSVLEKYIVSVAKVVFFKKEEEKQQMIKEQDEYAISVLMKARGESREQVLRLPIKGLFVSEKYGGQDDV